MCLGQNSCSLMSCCFMCCVPRDFCFGTFTFTFRAVSCVMCLSLFLCRDEMHRAVDCAYTE